MGKVFVYVRDTSEGITPVSRQGGRIAGDVIADEVVPRLATQYVTSNKERNSRG